MNKALGLTLSLAALLGTAPAQLRWTQHPTLGPGARELAGLAADPVRGRLVVWGGFLTTIGVATALRDTWEFDGQRWTLAPGAVPPANLLGPATWDPTSRRIIALTVGLNPSVYAFDGTRWQAAGAAPPDSVALVGDEHRGVLLVLDAQGYVHERTANGDRWVRAAVAGPRPTGGAAFDRARGVTTVVLAESPRDAGTFEWDGTTWTRATTDPLPVSGVTATLYDADRQRLVVVTANGLFERAGARWLPVPEPSTLAGCHRQFAAWTYDPTRGALAVFGGSCGTWGSWTSYADCQTLAPTVRARVEVRSPACSTTAGDAQLSAVGNPVLGNAAFEFDVAWRTTRTPGALALGTPARLALPGCTLFVNPLIAIPVWPDAGGGARVAVPVPLDLRLRQLGYVAQVVLAHSRPFAVATSQTLGIVIGD